MLTVAVRVTETGIYEIAWWCVTYIHLVPVVLLHGIGELVNVVVVEDHRAKRPVVHIP